MIFTIMELFNAALLAVAAFVVVYNGDVAEGVLILAGALGWLVVAME